MEHFFTDIKIQNKMSWSKTFQAFSDREKRALIDFPFSALHLKLESLRSPSNQGPVVVIPGAPEEALVLLRKITDPQDIENLIQIRKLSDQADRADYPEDIALYLQVLHLAPWDSISMISIGSSYANAGFLSKGIEWMRKAHHMDPGNARIKRNLHDMESF